MKDYNKLDFFQYGNIFVVFFFIYLQKWLRIAYQQVYNQLHM